MTRCDRFEREGLLLLEQGSPLDEHFATCPDCREAVAAYDRLRREIAAAGERLEPPPGWQSRVWAAVERRAPRRRRLRVLVPAGLAAALALTLVLSRSPRPPPAITLESFVEAGGGVRRGDEAHPGDVLELRAITGGAPHAELRVYLNDDEILLRCSDEPPCERRGNDLRASFVLRAIGSYRPLLLASDRPLPEPSDGLDRDAGSALADGARVEVGREVWVR